jgi:carbon-monoxide dehydrogenase catalytic subunit
MAKDKEPKPPELRVLDPASVEILKKAQKDGRSTAFDRMDSQSVQCKFGTQGLCCRICHMGPCRITPKTPLGVCGADRHTVVARNYLREVVGGAAAHSDHARGLVLLLKKVAQGIEGGYEIRDEKALRRNAARYGVEDLDRPKEEIAIDLADRMLSEFTSQEEALIGLGLAPLNRQGVWRKQAIEPQGIDRMLVESMHRSTMGVDHDYKNLLQQALRTALADGWGGSRIASIISDILFGTPQPVRSNVNLGVLGENTVNIVVHGHEPVLSEMLAIAVRDEEIETAAVQAGAEGVTLATGAGPDHRCGRDDGGRCPVLHAEPARRGERLPHRGHIHLGYRPDRGRRSHAFRRGECVRGRQGTGPARHRKLQKPRSRQDGDPGP